MIAGVVTLTDPAMHTHAQQQHADERSGPPSDWGGEERRNKPWKAAEVRLTDETIQYLEEKFANAVREGIAAAITEDTAEKFWGAGLTVLQKQAAAHTGRFVIGSLWGVVRRIAFFLLIGGLVYAFGGWGALAALFKALFHSGS